MSLTVGLTIGFAAAGAAGGALLGGAAKVGEGLFGIGLALAGDRSSHKTEVPSLTTCALVGGLAGGVFGYAAGEGYNYLTNDPQAENNTIIQTCVENTPPGLSAVISEDAIGNPICSYE